MPIKNSIDPIHFQMRTSANALVPGLGTNVAGFIMRDGGAGVALTGTFAELVNGGGTYVYRPIIADFNCRVYTLRFSGSGAVDTYLTGNTTESIVANDSGNVQLSTHRSF